MNNILIIGASGSIGSALLNKYQNLKSNNITAISRSILKDNTAVVEIIYDFNSKILPDLPTDKKFDLVIFATGHLHNEAYKPEKSIRDLNAEALAYSYRINCIIPALLIKELSQSFKDHTKIIFLSAKVGSISDNQLGGWYAYRMSKTALNMMIKNLAIELKRKYKNIIVCGLHPGTVASRLSSPFTGSVQHEIFSPSQSADYLIEVIENLTIDHSGKIYDYHSNEISP